MRIPSEPGQLGPARSVFVRRVIGSTVIVATTGSLLHFAWEFSGFHPAVAIFAATNGSVWEHMKLAFWPAMLLAPFQRARYGKMPGWLPGTAACTLLPSILIPGLFYAYTFLLGTHHLVLDLAIFATAILSGETLGHALLLQRWRASMRAASGVVLVLLIGCYAIFTYRPPSIFLFDPPTEISSGISRDRLSPGSLTPPGRLAVHGLAPVNPCRSRRAARIESTVACRGSTTPYRRVLPIPPPPVS